MIIAVTMLGMGFPASIVFGKVIPGAAVAVMVGNLYYAYMANRLAKKRAEPMSLRCLMGLAHL